MSLTDLMPLAGRHVRVVGLQRAADVPPGVLLGDAVAVGGASAVPQARPLAHLLDQLHRLVSRPFERTTNYKKHECLLSLFL